MSCDSKDIQEDYLEDKWVLWYHSYTDKDWTINSYKQLYTIETIQDFWKLFSNWNDTLPELENNMYFKTKIKTKHFYFNLFLNRF